MARITVEDCLYHIPNRFDLVMVAAKRARHLVKSGDEPFVPWENDKATVVALREIAEEAITKEYLRETPENLLSAVTEEQPAQESEKTEQPPTNPPTLFG